MRRLSLISRLEKREMLAIVTPPQSHDHMTMRLEGIHGGFPLPIETHTTWDAWPHAHISIIHEDPHYYSPSVESRMCGCVVSSKIVFRRLTSRHHKFKRTHPRSYVERFKMQACCKNCLTDPPPLRHARQLPRPQRLRILLYWPALCMNRSVHT